MSKIVFVVGNSRSGTTLISRILGRNDQVCLFSELHYYEQWVSESDLESNTTWDRPTAEKALLRMFTTFHEGFFYRPAMEKYHEEISELLENSTFFDPSDLYKKFLVSETSKKNKSIPLDHTPRNIYFAGDILNRFPDCHIINMIRDPRDILVSQKKKWRYSFADDVKIPLLEKMRTRANYNAILMTKMWKKVVNISQVYDQRKNFTSIKFEDLLSRPESTIMEICTALGIEYSEEMLEVPKTGSSTLSNQHDSKGVDSDRSQKWSERKHLGVSEITVLEKLVGKELYEYDYHLSDLNYRHFHSVFEYFKLISSLPAVFILNLGRYKNIFQALIKRFG
jgi:omega-hydroxy-beta-dihydromenaquinone-9 sulfotransferase